MNTIEIENLLRIPPVPKPPPQLRQRLLADVSLPEKSARSGLSRPSAGGWLRRWWPTLLPAAAALGAVSILTLQSAKIRSIQDSIANLSRNTAVTDAPGGSSPAAASVTATASNAIGGYEDEITRLKGAVAEATTRVAQLEQLRAANEALKSRIAAIPDRLSPEESSAMDQARERAMSIQCINNLKQFGLAVRVWANDNKDSGPPDILSMSRELSSPKVLACPADKGRVAADSFATYTPANCSYEFLAPSEPNVGNEPNRVLSRCPIHGHIGLCDGSVQGKIAKEHPEWLVEQDGKLYFRPKPESP